MMNDKTRSANRVLRRGVLLLAMAIPVGYGCSTSSGGEGAASPVSYTMTGTEALLPQPIDNVAQKTKAVLASNGIAVQDTSTEKGGDEREFKGKVNDLDVTVTLVSKGPQVTKVEVTAQKNLVEWNKDFAKKINDQIVAS